jgi:hypothetical protein
MYPHGDLSEVELRRVQVRDRIRLRRRLAELQLQQLAQPFRRLERLRDTWSRMAPVAAVAAIPVALLAGRRFRIVRWLGPLLRVAPLALAFARSRRTPASGHPARS